MINASRQSVEWASEMAFSRLLAGHRFSMLGSASGFLLITMLILPGNGLEAIDSKVFLPMMTGIPHVRFLKNFMSLGSFHNNALFWPMALFSEAATTNEIIMIIKLNYTATGALIPG
jgi:hypothetical protein